MSNVMTFLNPLNKPKGKRRLLSVVTFAEVIAHLRDQNALKDDDKIKFSVCYAKLMNGLIIRSFAIFVREGNLIKCQMLPSCGRFYARDTISTEATYQIDVLHDAIGDADGNVRLDNSVYIHELSFVEERSPPRELTEQQSEILLHVLDYLNAERECLRPIDPQRPASLALDFQLIAQYGTNHRLPFKRIEHHVLGKMPGVMPQAIADTLAFAGLRRVRNSPLTRAIS